MLVRMAALGLQPLVTEAFLKEEENNQYGLEEMKDSKDTWKFWIIAIIAINVILFAAAIFALWKLYKHVETAMKNYTVMWKSALGKRGNILVSEQVKQKAKS